MYVGEHTSQVASVGSVRSGLLSPIVGKGFAFFDKHTPAASAAGVLWYVESIL